MQKLLFSNEKTLLSQGKIKVSCLGLNPGLSSRLWERSIEFQGKGNSKPRRAYEGDGWRQVWDGKKKWKGKTNEGERGNLVGRRLEISVCCRINSSPFISSPPPLPPASPRRRQHTAKHPTPTQEKHQHRLPSTHLIPPTLSLTSHPPPPHQSLTALRGLLSHFPPCSSPPSKAILAESICLPRLSYCCHSRLSPVISHTPVFCSLAHYWPIVYSFFVIVSITLTVFLASFLSPIIYYLLSLCLIIPAVSFFGPPYTLGKFAGPLHRLYDINSDMRSNAVINVRWFKATWQRWKWMQGETRHLSLKLSCSISTFFCCRFWLRRPYNDQESFQVSIWLVCLRTWVIAAVGYQISTSAVSRCVSQCDLGAQTWTGFTALSPSYKAHRWHPICDLSIIYLYLSPRNFLPSSPSMSLFPLPHHPKFLSASETFLTPSVSLTLSLTSHCSPPSCSHSVSFYLKFLLCSFPLSLYLLFCLPRWEFGKHSVSLMKGKSCFTPPARFWFEIKGSVKYPPDTRADIYSIFPLLHPLSGSETEAMRRYEGADKQGGGGGGPGRRADKLVQSIGKGKEEWKVWERGDKLVWCH